MRNQKLAVSIAVGAAVIAAGVIFFRSKKGKQVLSSVKDAAGEASEGLKDQFANFSDKAAETIKKGRQHLHGLASRLKEETTV